MKRHSGVVGALVIATACGPIGDAPEPLTPLNECPKHPCDAFQQPELLAAPSCSQGVCTSATAVDFALVVSLPRSVFVDEGVTIAIPSFAAFSADPQRACQRVTEGTCVQLPTAARPSGSFIVSAGVEQIAGRPVDLSGASLPAQVHFLPLWGTTPASGSPTYVEASSLALPLVPIRAHNTSGGAGLPQGLHGPQGAPPTLWSAALGPAISYRRYIQPEDDAYPSVLGPPTAAANIGADAFTQIQNVDPEVTSHRSTFSVVRSGSLEDFTVYLRDLATGLRVSSRATLHGASQAAVTLLTVGQSPYGNPSHKATLAVVVVPPDGLPLPTFVDTVVVDQLGPTVPYPALPSAVTVSGTVRAADGATPIEADLLIDSTPATGTSGGITTSDPQDPAQRDLSYSATVHVGPDGRYQVVLPPGQYDVFLSPALGANAGAASVPLSLQPTPAGLPAVAAGKDLVAALPAMIQGVVKVADGRPMARAVVEAHPAAILAGTLDPRRWPRTFSTTADDSGAFSLAVDPGTYDVVVQPPAGTGFPWVTRASHAALAGEVLVLTPIAVPAPVAVEVVLHDYVDNALANTLVRAFAAPAGAASPSGPPPAPPLVQVELGAWLTDESGRVTMFVAPPQ